MKYTEVILMLIEFRFKNYRSFRDEAVASCLYTQIPESRINTELFNYHQKTE